MATTMKITHTIDGCYAVELHPGFFVLVSGEEVVVRRMGTIVKWELELLEYDGPDQFIEVSDEQLAYIATVEELDRDTRLSPGSRPGQEQAPPLHSTPASSGEHSSDEVLDPLKRQLSVARIEQLKKKGFNQSEIAAMYGVTRQAVSWHLKTYGSALSTRQIVDQAWPWKTGHGHDKAVPYKRLRDHGEFMQTGGKGMSDDKLKRLRSWWKRLRDEDIVVEFDPTLRPIKGVSPYGGFAYCSRTVEDGDLLIRVNEHTTLTEDGRRIWCWPSDSAG
ncbi:hypothetical protein [Rhodococcus pyridinivorans]|uniref:hypothetical protein n=1 Tax=Rhodococcus pyridinivorans TaxID=103816 RepID=UPI003AAFDF2F